MILETQPESVCLMSREHSTAEKTRQISLDVLDVLDQVRRNLIYAKSTN